MKNIITIFSTLIIIFSISCDFENENSLNGPQLKKDKTTKFSTLSTIDYTSNTIQYPISASNIFEYRANKDIYRGGAIELVPTYTEFDLDGGSLTPPDYINWGDPVEITFQIDKDEINNELIFTFGPHGCTFDPAARVIMDYSELGIEVPKLYYISDDGSYIEQMPDDVNVKGKTMTIYIHHFSRYAMSYGR